MPSASVIVPACPADVSFCRDDFLRDDFSVDGFLARYAGRQGLEAMRDELGMYVQVLRVAMIELINDDYADFVDLSSNLVGIDEKIGAIETPIGEFESDLGRFRDRLAETRARLDSGLARRDSLQRQRIGLRNLEHILNTLAKVERLLGLTGDGHELTGDLVERVSADVNYLNFCVEKCDAKAFVDEIRPRLSVIGDRLHGAMESQLLDALANSNKDVLKRCLRVYATVDRVSDAESVIRTKVVSPYLDKVISEDSLHADPLGLRGVCSSIMGLLPDKLDLLLQLTTEDRSRRAHAAVADFDIIGRVVWPEIVDLFVKKLPNIYSAGDPDRFHDNYTVVTGLIVDLESRLGGQAQTFRNEPAYCRFMAKWSLPVYYQIRFQEIAGPVEAACRPTMLADESSSPVFRLRIAETAANAIEKCWRPSTVLKPLVVNFWKLTLQIIARYCTAVSSAAETDGIGVNVLVMAYADVMELAGGRLDSILAESASKDCPLNRPAAVESLAESKRCLADVLPILAAKVTDTVSAESISFVRQVADIPRLYRRTNREMPTKACGYVSAMLEPIKRFRASTGSPAGVVGKLTSAIFSKIAGPYLESVTEVLEAVHKMEESLKRLKRVREKAEKSGKAGKSGQVSDDDKIRRQLVVDVDHFVAAMVDMGVEKSDVLDADGRKLVDLLEKVVREAENNQDSHNEPVS